MRGLTAELTEVFDRRLRSSSAAPLCVAFSGGGDSLLALLSTKAWADAHGRSVVVLCVDHGLQPQSRAWTEQAGRTTKALGVGFRALSWDGVKPQRGLATAARRARHALIAEAARALGSSVVVLGHTADDILEAERMREEGSTLGALREWAPSPVWPQGRGVFLLRPLLNVRRAEIRRRLAERGFSWIDDPANLDPRSPRARARAALAGAGQPSLEPDQAAGPLAALARATLVAPGGWARMDREALRAAAPAAARRWLAAVALCVGGGERTPRGQPVSRLSALVAGTGDFAATLAGAKIIAAGRTLEVFRDAGERRRGGLATMDLEPGVTTVWDGRFELRADDAGPSVRALSGVMARLDRAARRRLGEQPAAARPGLPVIIRADGSVRLAEDAGVGLRSLVADRLLAACGAVSQEPAA